MLVSFILLTYNQERYIRDSLISIFDQDYKDIEFIITDDCSKDKTVEIIKEVINSFPDKNIKLNINEKNLGLTGNLNEALKLCTGSIIALAAGDDISFKDRITRTVNIFQQKEEISFISFNDLKIDEDGNEKELLHSLENDLILNITEYISNSNHFFSGASRAFRKEVYDSFGDLSNKCPTEDTPYILRCFYLGMGYVFSKPGIKYRVHTNNLSSASSMSKMDIDEIHKQYLLDLNTAKRLDLISNSNELKILSWISFMEFKKNLLRSSTTFKKVKLILSNIFKPLVAKFILSKIKAVNEKN